MVSSVNAFAYQAKVCENETMTKLSNSKFLSLSACYFIIFILFIIDNDMVFMPSNGMINKRTL